jgi:hypothetical protein
MPSAVITMLWRDSLCVTALASSDVKSVASSTDLSAAVRFRHVVFGPFSVSCLASHDRIAYENPLSFGLNILSVIVPGWLTDIVVLEPQPGLVEMGKCTASRS